MKLTVTMVLPDGENRWYIEGLVEDAGEPKPKRALHLNLKPGERVPMIGDGLMFDAPDEEEG